ncbi:MAG TPA: hypothetical protein PKW90_25900, partial [Myxococcota bacterium]|nr:hypothetical protein [Myxococcota bacterium]
MIVLYPMNALVNDQLGRMRQWLGDPRLVSLFCDRWKLSRPLRFGRYTGRSLYPGVRRHVVRKDGAIERLKSGRPKFLVRDARRLDPKYTSTKRGSVKTVRSFYIAREAQALRALLQGKSAGRVDLQALELVRRLKQLGKWPAKPSMEKWFFGPQGDQTRNRWYKDGPALDGSKDEWLRAVCLPRDAELFTRHEVQAAPPDVLITNYSMLEFMLLRPLERSIFDKTRSFFEKNPDEKLLLVIDEAHLYRGTGGAEVAMLLRRLRERLGLPAERLQVICTSASFEGDAGPFAAKLTGKRPEDFNVVRSEVVRKVEAVEPTLADVAALCAVERDKFERPELT